MSAQIVNACLPWFAILVIAIIVMRFMLGRVGAKVDWSRLRTLNRCEKGSVQSLSFVLTLPVFVMIMMLIVQVSQIMIGNIVVHYAAYSAVRSASVWIPASVSLEEGRNRISSIELIDYDDRIGWRYRIQPTGEKYQKIRQAAVLGLVSLGPSRNLGYEMDNYGTETALGLETVYQGLDLESAENELIPYRLANKLAYSYSNTNLDLTFWHRLGPYHDYRDPPLQVRYNIPPFRDEYFPNEVGWQDHVTATVSYNLPLIPGPIRLFRQFSDAIGTDVNEQTYTYNIAARATSIVEGEKASLEYWQRDFVR